MNESWCVHGGAVPPPPIRWVWIGSSGPLFFRSRDRFCVECGRLTHDDFMVRNDLWRSVAERTDLLHFSCFERRLGREVTVDDLTEAPLNAALRTVLGRLKAERMKRT